MMDPNCQVCYEKTTLIAKHNKNKNNNNKGGKKTKMIALLVEQGIMQIKRNINKL